MAWRGLSLSACLQATLYVTRDVLMNEPSIAQDIGTNLARRQMASIDTAINRTSDYQTCSMQTYCPLVGWCGYIKIIIL